MHGHKRKSPATRVRVIWCRLTYLLPPSRRARTTPSAHDNEFVIGNGDVLNINVWKQPDLSRAVPVRSDGKVSLPLIGEVMAAGQTPAKLEEAIDQPCSSRIWPSRKLP